MKRKVFIRCAMGFPQGIAIGHIIGILGSFFWGNGHYSPCAPELVEMMGSELYAVMVQALLCGVLGAGFAGTSVIWEMENWSLVKQTGIYFVICSLILMPIAYISRWMEHSVEGVLGYFGIYALIFVIVWVSQFVIGKRNVEKMNARLGRVKGKE